MLWGDLQDLELLADFKRLIAARRSHPALVYGEVVTLSLDNERGLWLSERVHGEDRVLVAVNSSLRNGRVALPPVSFGSAGKRSHWQPCRSRQERLVSDSAQADSLIGCVE